MKAPAVPSMRLRFPVADVQGWADRYDYADDTEVIAIGREAGARGWYTRAELLTVGDWKTERQRARRALNTDAAVIDATRLALSTTDERLRIGVLTLLQGVGMPTASVLLHLAREDYPILDVRALWSLGVPEVPYHPFELWWSYTLTCRDLAQQAGVTMRVLDRGLWQYSAEHQALAVGVAEARP